MTNEKTKNANIRAATAQVSFFPYNQTGLESYPIHKQLLRSAYFQISCRRQMQLRHRVRRQRKEI